MTITDKQNEMTYAEADIVYTDTAGSTAIPFASATAVPEPMEAPAIYPPASSSSKPVAIVTGTPKPPSVAVVPQTTVVQHHHVQPPPEQYGRYRNNDGTWACCCITTVVVVLVFCCCVLPLIILLAVVRVANEVVNTIESGNFTFDDDFFKDDYINGSWSTPDNFTSTNFYGQ
jgi:hypothetical protein